MASEIPGQDEQVVESNNVKSILLELQELHRLAVPKLLINIVIYVQTFVSVYFLGMLGQKELAAGSFAVGFANIFGYSILTGLAQGIESICGQSFGGAKLPLLGLALQRMLIIMMLCSAFLCLLWTNVVSLLSAFPGIDLDMLNSAQTYLNYSRPDLFAKSLLLPLEIFLRSQQLTQPVMYTTTFSALLHLPINFLLLYRFDMGLRGVALAMSLTDFIHIGLLSLYLQWSGICRRTWMRLDWKVVTSLGPMLKLALNSCIAVAIEWWWYEIILLSASFLPYSEASVASMGILIRLTALTYMLPSSLAAAVSTRIGNELGANKPDQARIATLAATAYSFLWAFVACSFIIAMRNSWGLWFTKDATSLDLTSKALPVLGLCEIGNYPQTVAYGILMGSSRPDVSVKIYFVAFYLVGLPTAMILAFYFGVGLVGFWYGLLAAQITCAALMLYVVLRTSWVEQAHQTQARLMASECSHLLLPQDQNALLLA
ncbi:MATE family, multidrug and toxin extrusion protein [Marchantia polymorpha subsp. ruderalis]|uniref:Protein DETOXIFICATION n=2 Tax=Marchantia polymorpha TaxID=3197 RepID=A0AAF6BQZ5_MARPO|nr:hypothetical protein MARPO_0016s0203 [Marchantia polymorpha]BBN14429.1 hypothetical protein Mp_6g11640 [Marchantia polymorpha subsp. ruderalis]|eukprot:PTQ45163.1 hypothetical protein MARPO_0016s0203 [Marchantia polymorpha]